MAGGGKQRNQSRRVKIPLKIIKQDEQEDEEGYGQLIKRHRMSSTSIRNTTGQSKQSSLINNADDQAIDECSLMLNAADATSLSPVPSIGTSPHGKHSNSGTHTSSTPAKPTDPSGDQSVEEICDELLQGLCEEDLSYSTATLTSSYNNSSCLKLDQLMDDALFEMHDSNKGDEQPFSSYPVNTFYELPIQVLDYLKEYRGITKLYDWQDKCLCLPSVRSGHNLVYSLPTSGGKTLVAEILILQQLLLKKKDVLFILPFVSIVQEKVRELTPFAEVLNFAVEEYASNRGKIPPRKRRYKKVIYVATIEKANGLINSLIEQERLKSLGLVVVDELHMLGEGRRGGTLEACLAKLLSSTVNRVQIIAMSATLSNIDELARFLKADVYSSDFRPVELKEYIKLGRCVYSFEISHGEVDLIPDRSIESLNNSEGDVDQLSCLVQEVVPESPCLVFCPTKKNCENVALMLTKFLPKTLKGVKAVEKGQLLHQLGIEAAGLCPVLAKTIPWGIAYHHSGLTADERKLIEEAYVEKVLCVITCTSTLAAGVNLPAKRVILRCPLVGKDFMSRSQYKQMIGRAGRYGYCDHGESILIIQPKDKSKVVSGLIQGSYDSCHSCLLSQGTNSLTSLLLSLVALKLIKRSQDLLSFLKCTLLYQQMDHDQLLSKCEEALLELSSLKYITLTKTMDNISENIIEITNFGKAVHKGCIDVSIASQVYNDLMVSLDYMVLSTDLHLLYLVVPHEMIDAIVPNWPVYFEMISGFEKCEEMLLKMVKISVSYVSRKAVGASKTLSENESKRYTRFYLALILHHLLKHSSAEGVWLVSDMFQCSRGFIQSLIQQSAMFSSCLVQFTEELPELWALYLLLPTISQKLSYTVTIHLVPLMEIQGMKQGRARQLYLSGIKTPQDLVKCRAEELCDKIEHLHLINARKLIKSARLLLAEKLEMLQEEVEEMHTLIPDPS